MKYLKLLSIFFLLQSFFVYSSTLYIVANQDLIDYKEKLVKEITTLFDNKKNELGVSEVKYLHASDDEAPKFSTGDIYLFLFGWKDGTRSTIFFRNDGYFSRYEDLDKSKNLSLLIFIPLNEEAKIKIFTSLYMELLEDRHFIRDLKKPKSKSTIEYSFLMPLPKKKEDSISMDFSNINNFSSIVTFIKNATYELKEKKGKFKETEDIEEEKIKNSEKELEKERLRKENEARLKKEKFDNFAHALKLVSLT